MFTVSDLLKAKGYDIWSVDQETATIEAIRQLKEKDIGALLVRDSSDEMVGIISERDFVRNIAETGQFFLYQPVSEYMTRDVITVQADQTIDECVELMTRKHIRHLPVVDADHRLLGMISIGDVMKAHIGSRESMISNLSNFIEGRGYGQ